MENYNPENLETYKPHWKRRVTLARETKKPCLFDKVVTMCMFFYLIVGFLYILNDAFPHLLW